MWHVDRRSGKPLRQQLREAIEHGISFGDLGVGAALPSVRDLAGQAGVAPMTVSKVYAELKADGLIETRAGAGTFVADSPFARLAAGGAADTLRRAIDALIELASSLGARSGDILALLNARLAHRAGHAPRLAIVVVGLFADATASYALCVAGQVGERATVQPTTLQQIAETGDWRVQIAASDLILTFANLQGAVEALVPGVPVVSIRFIPSEATRMALASIDPLARVAVVSRFADFLPVLTLGVRRFAAHVHDVVAVDLETAMEAGVLADCDVIVMSTGADAAAAMARPGAVQIEYRHIPDPGDIDRLVLPLVAPLVEVTPATKGDDTTRAAAANARKEAS